MKKIKVLVIGSGGHAKSCIEVIESMKKFKIIGLIDKKINKRIGKYKVLFNDKDIQKIKKNTKNLVLGIGSLDNLKKRNIIFQRFKKLGFQFPKIISNNSTVSKNASIGEGTIVFNHVLINTGSVIGKNCIINNKSLIEHDAIIEDHVHISTCVTINGNCKIGQNSFIGSRAVLKNDITIKKDSFVKMGSIIKKNL
jgi:sugar O-acyltransferase (sialic acid O-acetyltransferase NeuD family)